MRKQELVLGGVAIAVTAALFGTASWAATTRTGTVPAPVRALAPVADAGRPKAQSAPPVLVARPAAVPLSASKPVSKASAPTVSANQAQADPDPVPDPQPAPSPAPEESLSPTSWFHYVPANPVPIIPSSVTPPREPGFQISLANPNVPYDPVTNPHPLYLFYKGCETRTAVCDVTETWGAAGY